MIWVISTLLFAVISPSTYADDLDFVFIEPKQNRTMIEVRSRSQNFVGFVRADKVKEYGIRADAAGREELNEWIEAGLLRVFKSVDEGMNQPSLDPNLVDLAKAYALVLRETREIYATYRSGKELAAERWFSNPFVNEVALFLSILQPPPSGRLLHSKTVHNDFFRTQEWLQNLLGESAVTKMRINVFPAGQTHKQMYDAFASEMLLIREGKDSPPLALLFLEAINPLVLGTLPLAKRCAGVLVEK